MSDGVSDGIVVILFVTLVRTRAEKADLVGRAVSD